MVVVIEDAAPTGPRRAPFAPGTRAGWQVAVREATHAGDAPRGPVRGKRRIPAIGLASYLPIAVSRSLAKSFQDLLKSLVELPFGHH